ncbi:MAG: hypothetical protein H6736_12185 [Alphaproteobacteria bacterium]|nr:hypothetical protein [Alphaproteobacteria bacterium]MCB9692563.1 hypothetical protein [Alphaproteobacteria bacterium]
MAAKGSDLAARLRAAVEREQNARSSEERAREAKAAAAHKARQELFESLVELGGQLPFLETRLQEGGVVFRRGALDLRFVPSGEEEVTIDFKLRDTSDTHRLYREPALEDRWIWVRTRGKREDRLPLFDRGLEVLLVHALELPDPDAPAPAQTTSGPSFTEEEVDTLATTKRRL